jgi:hypothetical protein
MVRSNIDSPGEVVSAVPGPDRRDLTLQFLFTFQPPGE